MDDDQVTGVIDEMERALLAEDPAFVQRVRRVHRCEVVNVVAVFVLLTVGAVLLTVGFATAALLPWSLGLAALIGAVLVDDHHKRTLR